MAAGSIDIPDETSELPFLGGLIGYWGYDLGRKTLSIPSRQASPVTLPQARLGLYDWCITLDHMAQQAWLIATPQRREQVEGWLTQSPAPTHAFTLTDTFKAELSHAQYVARFNAVQRYIRAGDCYQINLAQRFYADYQGMSGRHTCNCAKPPQHPIQALWPGATKRSCHFHQNGLFSAATAR